MENKKGVRKPGIQMAVIGTYHKQVGILSCNMKKKKKSKNHAMKTITPVLDDY